VGPHDKILDQLVSGEGSLFDVPPAALGRFRVVHQIGAGTFGPVFRATDPESNTSVAVKQFTVRLTPTQAAAIARDLVELVTSVPRLGALASPLAAGLEEMTPYLAMTLANGDSLDVALREFGPAALADLLPRARLLAEALDEAAACGVVHGALHPRDVIVSERETTLTGIGIAPLLKRQGVSMALRRPYAAPELAEGEVGSAADQYALAALVFEWMTGRRLAGLGGVIEIPELAGVDRDRMREVFTRARHESPDERFPSSVAFLEAVAATVSFDASAPVPAPPAESPKRATRQRSGPQPVEPPPLFAGVEGESRLPTDETPVRADVELGDTARMASMSSAPPEFLAGATERAPIRASFGAGVVVAAAVAGTLVGIGVGYSLWGRTTTAPSITAPAVVPAESATGRQGTDVPVDTAPAAPRPEPPTSAAQPPPAAGTPAQPTVADRKPAVAENTPAGQLLVRSDPPGATVFVDEARRGQTPVAIRNVNLGTRRVRVQRDGYVTAERQVTLTSDRPSRSLDVRLTAAPPARPAPAPPARPAATPQATTGTLLVESRPAGATVLVNNRNVGVTPVTVQSLAPGQYIVHLELAGYLPFETTVRVVAGERARAAASLTLQEPE
jgi:serine/threonine-protein kinase